MNYYISRDGQQFGPYTLAEVQRYVADGNILLTDLAHCEGMASWVPVQQILSNNPAKPPSSPPAAPNWAQAPVYQQQPMGVAQQPVAGTSGPLPPDLHWALVLVIGIFCSIFMVVWMFIEAGFVKKLRPSSNAGMFYGLGIGAVVLGYIVIIAGASMKEDGLMALAGLIILAGSVMIIVGHFTMKSALEEYYNTVEPINLRLSGVMTFFFNIIYFQYHFNRIRQYKTTGILR